MAALVSCKTTGLQSGFLRQRLSARRFTGPRISAKGFSILEILIAFVVMALVVGSLLRLFGTSVRNVTLTEEYSFAVQVAESRMQAVGAEIPVEKGSVDGEERGTGYRWAVTMEPVELDEEQETFSLSIQPYQVNVVVSWDSAGKQRQFVLSSLRFGEQI